MTFTILEVGSASEILPCLCLQGSWSSFIAGHLSDSFVTTHPSTSTSVTVLSPKARFLISAFLHLPGRQVDYNSVMEKLHEYWWGCVCVCNWKGDGTVSQRPWDLAGPRKMTRSFQGKNGQVGGFTIFFWIKPILGLELELPRKTGL